MWFHNLFDRLTRSRDAVIGAGTPRRVRPARGGQRVGAAGEGGLRAGDDRGRGAISFVEAKVSCVYDREMSVSWRWSTGHCECGCGL